MTLYQRQLGWRAQITSICYSILFHAYVLNECCYTAKLLLGAVRAHFFPFLIFGLAKRSSICWRSDSLVVMGCHCTTPTLGSSSVKVTDTQRFNIALVQTFAQKLVQMPTRMQHVLSISPLRAPRNSEKPLWPRNIIKLFGMRPSLDL